MSPEAPFYKLREFLAEVLVLQPIISLVEAACHMESIPQMLEAFEKAAKGVLEQPGNDVYSISKVHRQKPTESYQEYPKRILQGMRQPSPDDA